MPLNGNQAEQLAYWYFRLNGYFTIRDFVVHPDLGTEQKTDIDIFGVRFPRRSELLVDSMKDDDNLIENKIHIVLVEVKSGLCDINDTWSNKDNQNIERFINAVGALPKEKINDAATSIYSQSYYEDDQFIIEIILVGKEKNQKLGTQFPELEQFTFENILKFIFKRFQEFHRQKRSHGQWDDFGKELWRNFDESKTVEEFVQKYL